MTMGEKILNMRKARGWSQEELADRVGVSRQAVSRWESGSAKPDADKIIVICDLFGISADYLLRDSYTGEAGQRITAVKQSSVIGDAFRRMTLKQWGGLALLVLSSLVNGVIYVLSKVYPATWVQNTPDYIQFADGLMGFLLTHELVWLWLMAWLGVITGILILLGDRLKWKISERLGRIYRFLFPED